ncbi:TetR/AcrR family transcriptional regulator [Sulfurospirillum sp. T05]|uniref:TetR/AcrR family transcriptional regulator n=1 Tax=Sulfurospirillum tamanense TaxID=2813362 RepID=A0ABS2WUN6_9BACT|nr:TetR/AcrR family transcriptional regulator [Sulfurospirillum tamanensis]MBN2965293.1 TetR/AcrR family transcriptional regulator [Sulfurospirillum tamanensis]
MARIIDKEEKRNDIARASIALFCDKGIQQTSMDAIAKSAGVAKGTIYLYFKNKEEIIFAIWDMIVARHHEAYTKRITDAMSAKEKILDFFNFGECAEEEDKEQILSLYQHFISAMLIDKTGLYTAYFESFFQKDFDFIIQSLREGEAKGEFVVENIELLTTSITLLIKGLLVRAKASNMGFYEAQSILIEHITFLLSQCTQPKHQKVAPFYEADKETKGTIQ